MIQAGWEIRIERPQQEVFEFVANPANASTWSNDPERYELTTDVSKPPDELAFTARRPGAVVRVRFRFTPAGAAATGVSCEAELRLQGLVRVFEPLLAAIARRGVETSRGAALKAALERS